MKRLFSRSRRQRLVYLVLFFSFSSIFYGLFNGADMLGLGSCLTPVAGATLGYLWGETKRRSDYD